MRRTALLATATATAACLPAAAPAAERPEGRYSGDGGRSELSVAGRSIDVAAFDFRCGKTRGRTSLSDIRIAKKRGRWRFSVRMYGNATYRDDRPDENVRVRLRGRFSPSGRVATGLLTVRAPSCSTVSRKWTTVRLLPRPAQE